MIAVIDFYRISDEHVPVNASLLFIICEQYKEQSVQFYAEETHIDKVQSYWQSNNITVANIIWEKVKFNGKAKEGLKLVVQRIQNELRHLISLMRKKEIKPDAIFFLSLSPFSGFIYKRFFFKNVHTLITLHGDVEFIRMRNSFSRNLLGKFFRLSFQIKKPDCQYIVLSKIVKQNLVAEGYLNANEIIAIYHPYIFKKDIPCNEYKQPIIFAHIGIASIEKQAHYLYDIAEYFEEDIQQKRMRFKIIGRNENLELNNKSHLIDGIKNKQMLDRSVFESAIEKIHYAVFFYKDNYQLTGSGAFMDVLDFEKPVIALRNQLFETFFADAGNIGYLCNTIDEMKKIIKDIVAEKVTEADYKLMQLNMHKFKKHFSPHMLKRQLFEHTN